jgi:D-glycero-alpha-D-manno-heptose-7-phosphate kinase
MSTQGSIIHAVAPTRICDVGGWTDTWFSKHGAIFNIAVAPQVEVQIRQLPAETGTCPIVIRAENYREVYEFDPIEASGGKHPLIEAALMEMPMPENVRLEVTIYSGAPPGASMGTSAAVSVALIGALDALTPGRHSPVEIARLAHRLETEKLGLECGVQDQLASACGGLNLIRMPAYPDTEVEALVLSDTVRWELEQRLLVIYIGKPHQSSEIHRRVIHDLGDHPESDSRLDTLRSLAVEAAEATRRGDFTGLGQVFNRSTEVQRKLHPDLVCPDFEEIIAMATDFGASGCKVNGAGVDGGSVAILCSSDMARKRELEAALGEKRFRSLPVQLAPDGLRVWQTS